MTSLDPSHIPGLERTSNPRTGQAVKTSVSSIHSHTSSSNKPEPEEEEEEADSSLPPSNSQPSWKGAWARRQEAKIAQRRKELGLESDEEEDSEDEGERRRGDGKIPIPPIPDLRYEQGILASIRPFLHSTTTEGKGKGKGVEVEKETEKHELKVEAAEKTALASAQLTAEGEKSGKIESDVLMGPLRVEWGNVTYVLLRDQVIFPLLQGVMWGMAGIYLNGLWEWNRTRLAAKNVGKGARRTGPGLLSRLGLTTA